MSSFGGMYVSPYIIDKKKDKNKSRIKSIFLIIQRSVKLRSMYSLPTLLIYMKGLDLKLSALSWLSSIQTMDQVH